MKKIYSLLIAIILCGAAHAQYTLKGKVYDANGKPLSGAFIFEKGSMNGTTSAADGTYSISYRDSASEIVFSYVGYLKNQIVTEGRKEYNAAMILANTAGTGDLVGTRKPGHTPTEAAVGVEIIDVARITNTSGQIDLTQLLQQELPSFNANKQSGAGGADHADPVSLRGMGPDQILVLINGKRMHQSANINLAGTRGRGNTGADLNTIPASAVERIEILRDGACAQYGSDAIAGVINVVLKSGTGETNGSLTTGMNNARISVNDPVAPRPHSFDGETWGFNGNQGTKIGKDGFANFTLDYSQKQRTNRKPDSSVIYGFGSPYNMGLPRQEVGDAAYSNLSLFMNSVVPAGENTEVYAFGGYNYRMTDAYGWSINPNSERNNTSLYHDGFTPRIQSAINDRSFSAGVRSRLGSGWNMDFNNTYGSNRFHYFANNTLNATLLDQSPTRFDAGGFSLTENTSSVNFSKLYSEVLEGLHLSFGSEFRTNTYQIFAGDAGSYTTYGRQFFGLTSTGDSIFRPGGAQGMAGFRPTNEVNESRTNAGVYGDAELDVTDNFLLGGVARVENYSDFGAVTNGKLAARYKLSNYVSLRAAYGTGFRAPSLQQQFYNSTYTDYENGQNVDKVIVKNDSPLARALGVEPLKPEKSSNVSYGFAIKRKAFSFTVDAYSIIVMDRIVLTGPYLDTDPLIGGQLRAMHVASAQFFANAVNTTTNGVDIVLRHTPYITEKSALHLTLAANFNGMRIDQVNANDQLKGSENRYFGIREQYFMKAAAPKSRVTFNAEYTVDKFFVDVRANYFAKVELINRQDNRDSTADENEIDTYRAKVTFDLSLGYNFNNIRITLGGMNILNTYPDNHDPYFTESGGLWDAVQMGFAGAYYYTKVGFRF